jgi:cation diffusion facilitator family transporter
MAGTTSHILQSLVSNVVLAAAKGAAALYTGSGALMAEAIHTAADTGNQLLLLVGVRESRRPPDATHPLGYGRSTYFWSFMVALLLFSGGGVLSIYEGVHKLGSPQPVEKPWVGLGILGFSLLLDLWLTLGNLREMKKRRGDKPLVRYLRDTKDSDLVVVFGENAAAVLGVAMALGAFIVSWMSGDGRWDAMGSIAVGVVLVGVALFLAIEVRSLLLGEAADPEVSAHAIQLAVDDPRIESVSELITLQQGPGEVLVALKIRCRPDLTAAEVSQMINEFEARLRQRCPVARFIFVEPDLAGPMSVKLEDSAARD